MLFCLLLAPGLLILSSTVFTVGTCYYFLVQSMLQKSKGASSKEKHNRQHNLITLTSKKTAQQRQNICLAGNL